MASKKRNAVSAKRRVESSKPKEVESSKLKETVSQKAIRYKLALFTGKQSNGRPLTSTQRSYNQGFADCFDQIKGFKKHRA